MLLKSQHFTEGLPSTDNKKDEVVIVFVKFYFDLHADVDECAVDHGNCSENAICTNLLGSYNCTCPTGFYGDAFNCTGE